MKHLLKAGAIIGVAAMFAGVPAHVSAQTPASDEVRIAALKQRVGDYEQLVARLEAQEAIENIQAAWGYYVEEGMYDRAAALMAPDASFEYGQRGVYRGRDRVRQAMELVFGAPGPNWLNINMQLQPFISVAEDGLTAQARWRSVQQFETSEGTGRWGAGIYENEYVKIGDTWSISGIHYYVTFLTDYDQGWQNAVTIPMEGPDAAFPPDAPPTEVYRSLPGAYLPPYHFRNPVSGKSVQWPE